MKTYRNNWEPCKLVVNFNQKQWRQDLASFVVSRLNWFNARVTRSKIIEETNLKSIKEFEIYNHEGRTFKVKYADMNKIISSSNDDIINDYLNKRIFNN